MIKPSCDSKTRFYKSQQNTFGLLPGPEGEGTCPGATVGEGGCWSVPAGRKVQTCYVANLMRIYSGVGGVLRHNTTELREAATVEAMTALLSVEFQRFKDVELRRSKRTGEPVNTYYRLHWSGDVFNNEYAQALKDAMLAHPDLNFWGYTRCFFAIPILASVPNLIIYISLDPVNAVQGLIEYAIHGGPTNDRLRLCYMSKTNDIAPYIDSAKRIIETNNQTYITNGIDKPRLPTAWLDDLKFKGCPVDDKLIPTEGGCAKCGRCFRPNTSPVFFKT